MPAQIMLAKNSYMWLKKGAIVQLARKIRIFIQLILRACLKIIQSFYYGLFERLSHPLRGT